MVGFPCQNVGEIDFPPPVERSDRNVASRTIQHLFSLDMSPPWITLLIKSSIN